jgi:hypothetical protein
MTVTVTVEQAVNTLYKQVGNEPYKTTASWVNTQKFELASMLQMAEQDFVLDLTLINPQD